MTSEQLGEVWDNTGGSSPDEKPHNLSHVKTPWPTEPFDRIDYLFHDDDPRSALLKRAEQKLNLGGKERWIMVTEDEVRAILHLRTCRSTHVFGREIGLTKPFTAFCVHQAGHTNQHSNGYYTWNPELIAVK